MAAHFPPESVLILLQNGCSFWARIRTLDLAQAVLHQVAVILAPDCIPLFLSDGYKDYLTAIVTQFGQWVQFPRRRATDHPPKPRWMPQPQLLYAQVIKTMRRRRLV